MAANTRENHIRLIRERLQKRRRELITAIQATRGELSALKEAERDPEYEEGAQTELADYTLSQLVENQRRELMLIDAAFQRMDAGEFGRCVDCGAEIPLDRLEAVPFAIRCEEDARLHEQERTGGAYASPTM
ncbi:MAG: TraR/DksA family transcriptional regulator [Myxococcaceae bacterium]|nr:TraR/DksA family transcriptional regulator [Myxococcaceae bacterium]